MLCNPLLLVLSFMNKASGLFFFCWMFPMWLVSTKWMCHYLSALYCAFIAVYTECMFIPIMFDTRGGYLAQVIMLQFRYTVKRKGGCVREKQTSHMLFVSGLQHTVLICVPWNTPFHSVWQAASLFQSFLLWADRWEPQSPERGSLITVKPGYIMRDMSGGGWWGGLWSRSLSDLPSVAQADLKGSSGNDQSPG